MSIRLILLIICISCSKIPESVGLDNEIIIITSDEDKEYVKIFLDDKFNNYYTKTPITEYHYNLNKRDKYFKSFIKRAYERVKKLESGEIPYRKFGKPIHVPTGQEKVSQIPKEWKTGYKPDFHLIKKDNQGNIIYDVYIEHFGLDKDGNPPKWWPNGSY